MSDLISRADAIDACCRGWNNTAEDCIRNIKELPSADADADAYTRITGLMPDAVQGEWIDRSDGGRIIYPWWESCECNQCGEYGSGAYNFCPNCGARMKGGAE